MSETLVTHRNNRNKVAIIFVHGFGGDPKRTWGEFPSFLSHDQRIHNWDIYSLGFPSGFGLDLVGIWKANPAIVTIGKNLITYARIKLKNYRRLAIVAHSMGGLVVQRALIDNGDFERQVGHVFFFGTPSNGLKKALFFQFWKRQFDNMAEGGQFITNLRERWNVKFRPNQVPFQYWVIAGDQDEFVPQWSSHSPFPEDRCFVVPGDHLSIVKPESSTNLSVQIVLDGLIGYASSIGVSDAAQRAIENRQFREAIDMLECNKGKLDETGLVRLALAYEGVDRQADALEVLQLRNPNDTNAMGVLAGRLKRRWLLERQAHDSETSQSLYQEGLKRSLEKRNIPQAYYHGINLAFMVLASGQNLVKAQEFAKQALEQCALAPKDKWRFATEGEASLLLGDVEEAIRKYKLALTSKPSPIPREVDSMMQQAIKVASLLGYEDVANRLLTVFGRNEV